DFYMPDIGEGVVEGEIVTWKVKEGDTVKLDQPIVEVMTDKATVELPSPRAGTIAKINYKEGQICPVGQVLVVIEEAAAAGAAAPASRAVKPEPHPIGGAQPRPDNGRGTTVPRPPAAPSASPTMPVPSLVATPATGGATAAAGGPGIQVIDATVSRQRVLA